jgi:hypothetical protein
MKGTPLHRRAMLRARTPLQRSSSLQRAASMAATDAPRAAVAGRVCIVCGTDRRIDPAHLISQATGGCGAAACCVPLCRPHHRAYDRGELDLVPYLEPAWRAQLAHAVGHVGLIGGAAANQSAARRCRPRRRDGGLALRFVTSARARKQPEPDDGEHWSPSRPLDKPHPSAVLEVTAEEYDALMADLEAPSKPNDALRRTTSLHPLPTE